MTVTLAYSSDAVSRAHQQGWDAFDLRVLRTVEQIPGATFSELVEAMPSGIHLRLISVALRGLVADGSLKQGRALVDGRIVRTYAAVMASDTRKAA